MALLGSLTFSTRKISAHAGIRPRKLQYYYRTKQDDAERANRHAALVVALLEGLTVFRFGRGAALEDPALAGEVPRLALPLTQEIHS